MSKCHESVDEIFAVIAKITKLAEGLPGSAEVGIAWNDAPADLVLELTKADGVEVRDDDPIYYDVAWHLGSTSIRAQCRKDAPRRAALRLVKP